MRKNGLVTVVVPVYKVEKYLDRCVLSIVNQTYKNLEIILVDDGSPDQCPQMCDEWAERDARIRVIHKENAGLGMARNTGITHANGQYICFFDSDDFVDLSLIEKACKVMNQSYADLVVFGMKNVDAQGLVRREYIPQGPDQIVEGEKIRTEFLPDLIYNNHLDAKYKELCLSGCTCMYAMDLISKTGWHFVSEREIISEDSYSLLQLFKYVQCVAVLPDALYYYCMNESSLTHTYREDRFEKNTKFYQETIRLAQENGYSQIVAQRIADLYLSFSIAALKQVVEGLHGLKRQYREVRKVVHDSTIQEALQCTGLKNISRSKNLLYAIMKMQWTSGILTLLMAKHVLQKAGEK